MPLLFTVMSTIKAIRERLRLTQTELAGVMGCTQPNIGHYEADRQPVPADRAILLIDHAATKGLKLTLDQVYGRKPLPAERVGA